MYDDAWKCCLLRRIFSADWKCIGPGIAIKCIQNITNVLKVIYIIYYNLLLTLHKNLLIVIPLSEHSPQGCKGLTVLLIELGRFKIIQGGVIYISGVVILMVWVWAWQGICTAERCGECWSHCGVRSLGLLH